MSPLTTFLVVYPGVAVVALAIPLLAWRWFAVPRDRMRTEWLLVAAGLMEPADALAQFTANWLSWLRPLKYDLFVYRMDGLFGEPSFQIGQVVASHRWLILLVSVSYGCMPVAMLGTFAVYLWMRSAAETLVVARTLALNLFASVGFYLLFPVCGPAFAFPKFPLLPPPHLSPHLMAIAAAPNGVPSVHTSTALLTLYFLRRWRWGRVGGGIFLILTAIATLGSGQHYLFDLLCAVPYAAGIVWLGRSRKS